MPETSPIAATEAGDPASITPGSKTPESTAAVPETRESTTPGSNHAESSSGSMFDAVAQVVKIIRPAIQADQGDIFLKGVDETSGVVSVELVGACISCPASTQTLKQGLERILKQRVEGVTEVIHVGEALAGADEGTAVTL